MRKYDVQELLRQQKNSVQERILTIFLAVSLGICSSGIFEEVKDSIHLHFFILVFIIILLLLIPLFWVFVGRNNLIKIKDEVFTTLICFDTKKDFTPVQFTDYGFSVETQSYWNSVVKNNKEINERFRKEHIANSHVYLNYREYYDYKVVTDLLQYIILSKISSGIPKNTTQNELLCEPKSKAKKLFFNLIDYFMKYKKIHSALNRFKFINDYYKKKTTIDRILFFSDGIPLMCLPEQIRNNLFVSTLHGKQADYEKEILENREIPTSFSYVPFLLSFPDYISIKFEDSNDSRISKIVLTRDNVGKLTIDFHDRWRYLSQRAFVQTTMRPGNRHNLFEEIFFEITIDLDIKKYAYFPLVGGGEKATDEFISWANEIIEKLGKYCDWSYYQKYITRDTLEEIKNKLDFHDWESRIEYYDSFDDTDEGKIERLLRLLLSPHFEIKKSALNKIKINKNKIQSSQLEFVILRILRLAHSSDQSTAHLATKTLTHFSAEIPYWLHKKVVEELLDIANSEHTFLRVQAMKNLGKLFNLVNDKNLKEKIQDRVIQAYSSKIEDLFLLDHEGIINDVYPNLDAIYRYEYEKKFLEILKSQDKEALDSAFLFFVSVKSFISEELIKQTSEFSSEINICELNQQTIKNYLIFLGHITNLTSSKSLDAFLQDSIQNHYKIIMSLICNKNNEIKILCIKNVLVLNSFINLLRSDQKDIIYTKLKLFLYSGDKDIKYNSLEAICIIADCFRGREDDIARIILENIDSQDPESTFPYIASDCFNKIESRIIDESLLKDILRFQETVRNL